MKYLYHCDDVNVEDVIDGTLYVIQPNKIVEVKDDFHAAALLAHKVHQGLIEVTVTPNDNGFDWTPGYKQMAADALGAADDARIQDWVTGQVEERVRKNYPPLPPSDRLKVLIKRRGVSIENFGLRPVEIRQGQQPIASPADSVNVTELIQQRNTLDARLKQEQAERAADRNMLKDLAAQVAEMRKAQGKGTPDENNQDASGNGSSENSGQGDTGSVAGQPGDGNGEQSESGQSVTIGRPSSGNGGTDAGTGGNEGGSAAPDPTRRPVRRPNQRR